MTLGPTNVEISLVERRCCDTATVTQAKNVFVCIRDGNELKSVGGEDFRRYPLSSRADEIFFLMIRDIAWLKALLVSLVHSLTDASKAWYRSLNYEA
jgi:hypothetical protein